MNDMSRRELFIAMLQALLLSLFPWLRTERGAQVVREALEATLPENIAVFKGGTMQISIGIKGFEMSDEWMRGDGPGAAARAGTPRRQGGASGCAFRMKVRQPGSARELPAHRDQVVTADADAILLHRALDEVELPDAVREAFEDMLSKIERRGPLSSRQRAWVKATLAGEKYDAPPEYENLVSSGRVPRGREVPEPEALKHRPLKPPQRRSPE